MSRGSWQRSCAIRSIIFHFLHLISDFFNWKSFFFLLQYYHFFIFLFFSFYASKYYLWDGEYTHTVTLVTLWHLIGMCDISYLIFEVVVVLGKKKEHLITHMLISKMSIYGSDTLSFSGRNEYCCCLCNNFLRKMVVSDSFLSNLISMTKSLNYIIVEVNVEFYVLQDFNL